jgi:uncharacterized protein
MSPPRLVNDFAGILDTQQNRQLEAKLRAYNDSTSTEVTIVTLASIGGDDVTRFAIQLGEEWGVGKRGQDNGIVILVAVEDRLAAIVTGYGMEGVVTDADTYQIRQRYMNPAFRQGNYYKGLDEATTAIFKLAAGEWTSAQLRGSGGGEPVPVFLILGLFLLIALVVVLSMVGMVKSFKKNHAGGKNLDFWTMLILANELQKRKHGSARHGGFGGFSGGRGSFGGGSSFGGFGGGSFGGGGSGGRW